MIASRLRRPSRGAVLAVLTLVGLSPTSFAADTSAAAGAPSRIVSIGGSVTEIVYALGQQKRLVAVDTTSIHPREASELPNVGYMRQLAAEGVLALDPDLILAIEGSGPPPAVQVLKASAVPFTEVPESHSAEGVLEKITVVGKALGVPARADALKAEVSADFEATAKAVAKAKTKPGVLFLLSVGSGRMLAAGSHSAADAVIDLAGGHNVLASFDGYKPVNAEALVAASPDYIVAMTRPGVDPSDDIRALPGIELTPAGKNDRIVTVDGQTLLGFGPHTAAAIRELARRIGTLTE
ncbi:iron complex transport system substrate-binding protein [Breoghania corrubedonensis]|uniref:Iron complex transport system substrate-binding protein n=1 Tax=Breoghania corrubedonensis TaxID=665038 RepID=A0A2T5VD05_9HYPH|nr:ABC transporter substrate-binding protein [Breoghania corrubedonensis]PTW61615.1 iron complex transport system substrate-binding protein [Breoghania corrubedonensis]